LRHGRRRGSERVGVDPVGGADPGDRNARGGDLSVDVNESRRPLVAAQLAVLDEALKQLVDAVCELLGGAAVGQGEREDVGLRLARRNVLDFDSHRGAMLADARRSLRCGWGFTSVAFAPIEETWPAAQPLRPCASPASGAAGAATRWRLSQC